MLDRFRSSLSLLACAGIAGLLLASPVSARELVANGSFETGTITPDGNGGQSLPNGSTIIPDWTVTPAEIAWITTPNNFNGITATDGIRSLDLTGYHDSPAYGGVTQTLTTVIGTRYALSFDLGVNTSYGSLSQVQATVGGVSSIFNFDAPQAGQSWTKKVLTFTATSTSTALTLAGSGNASGVYIGLDNVSVNELVGTQLFSASIGLNAGAGNKQKIGSFAGGEQIRLTFGGNGDLVNSNYQVRPDGSLFAPAGGPYAFANEGAAYPTVLGGDGINHFVGGGANYDASGSGLGFAGAATTDTLNPGAIRMGAVVGTFNPNPTANSADWFYIGPDMTFSAPIGGGDLYIAVNDTNSADNHGIYNGTLSVSAPAVTVPESGAGALFLAGGAAGMAALGVLRRKRTVA